MCVSNVPSTSICANDSHCLRRKVVQIGAFSMRNKSYQTAPPILSVVLSVRYSTLICGLRRTRRSPQKFIFIAVYYMFKPERNFFTWRATENGKNLRKILVKGGCRCIPSFPPSFTPPHHIYRVRREAGRTSLASCGHHNHIDPRAATVGLLRGRSSQAQSAACTSRRVSCCCCVALSLPPGFCSDGFGLPDIWWDTFRCSKWAVTTETTREATLVTASTFCIPIRRVPAPTQTIGMFEYDAVPKHAVLPRITVAMASALEYYDALPSILNTRGEDRFSDPALSWCSAYGMTACLLVRIEIGTNQR